MKLKMAIALSGFLALAPAAAQEAADDTETMQRVIISGERLVDEESATPEVADLIDRADFSVRGDSDIAAALARSTGVSVAGGKYIYVRGLNERFSNTAFNGSVIPSPSPLRNVAPLDIFPTSIVESALVQKTFSVRNSADFAGAAIDIRVLKPDPEGLIEAKFSVSGNSVASFRSLESHPGNASDFAGLAGGVRAIDPDLALVLDSGSYGDLPIALQNALSRSIVDRPQLLLVGSGMATPDLGGQLVYSDRFDFGGDSSLGVVAYISYDNDWRYKDGLQGIGKANSSTGNLDRFDRKASTNTVSMNLLASFDAEIGADHSLGALVLASRATDKVTEVRLGSTPDREHARDESLEWIARDLVTGQFRGRHFVPAALDLQIDWRVSASQALRDAPYGFQHAYERNSPDVDWRLASGSSVSFSDISDRTFDAGIDFKLPVPVPTGGAWGELAVDVSAGAAWTGRYREAQSNTLTLSNPDASFQAPSADEAYRRTFGDSAYEAFSNATSSSFPAYYRGAQSIFGYYLGLDLEFAQWLRLTLGTRGEYFSQTVETRAGRASGGSPVAPNPYRVSSAAAAPGSGGFSIIQPARATWHPALTLTLAPLAGTQLRFGYSRTVNRPKFRELGPSLFSDPENGEQYTGNPLLVPTDIDNVDLRVTHRFSRRHSFSAGAFYKNLDKPIEAYNAGQGESALVTYVNIDRAQVWGVELEYGLDLPLGEWLDREWELGIEANVTWSDSAIGFDQVLLFDQARAAQIVGAGGAAASRSLSLAELRAAYPGLAVSVTPDFDPDRHLQGQSEYLANLQVGLKLPSIGADLVFLLNYQGDRIRAVESNRDSTPAIVERPPLRLDLVARYPFSIGGNTLELGLKITNLANQPYYAFQRANDGGTITVDQYSEGITASIRIAYEY